MKDIAVFLTVLLIIVGLGIWQVKFLEESSRYLKTDLKYVEYYLNLERYHDAGDTLTNVKNTWNNMEDTWSIFIHHDDIGSVEVSLAKLEAYIESEEKIEAVAEIESIISNIDYTIECERLKFKNVF